MTTILIGYRGTGKSTVATLVAQHLSQPAYDSDVEVERRARKTITQIFADDGEACFRDLEVAVIKELAEKPNAVLALGGGAVMRPENCQVISTGSVVWLKATAETIFARISADQKTADQRPSLTAFDGLDEITALLEKREPVYADCADCIIDTEGKTAEQVADEVVYFVKGKAAP